MALNGMAVAEDVGGASEVARSRSSAATAPPSNSYNGIPESLSSDTAIGGLSSRRRSSLIRQIESFSDYRESSASSDPFHYDALSKQLDAMSSASTSTIAAYAAPSPAAASSSLSSEDSSPDTSTSSDRNKDLPPAPGSASKASFLPNYRRLSNVDAVESPFMPLADCVQALHDYSAADTGSNVCLSFSAGQLIRVLNKDPSGWWDGEIDAQRGWFPSNFVTSEVDISRCPTPMSASSETFAVPFTSRRSGEHGRSSYIRSRATSTVSSVASESMRRAASSPVSATAPRVDEGWRRASMVSDTASTSATPTTCHQQTSVTSGLHQAVGLMQSAVDAQRVAHYQPAATCLMTSVRSILSATECLAKDSTNLRAFPSLARERRQILSVLAALVTQAGKASSGEMNEQSRETAAVTLLQMANKVVDSVNRFLTVAHENGVTISTSHADHQSDLSLSQLLRIESISTAHIDQCMQTFPDSNDAREERRGSTSTEHLVHKAKSTADIRALRKASRGGNGSTSSSSSHDHSAVNPAFSFLNRPPSSPHLPRSQLVQAAMARRPSIPAPFTPAEISPTHLANESMHSDRSSVSMASSGPNTPADPNAPQMAVDVYRSMSAVHDQLLSTIAAFIGHVHAHSRASHSSSYTQLIDITQEILARVKEAIIIADGVAQHPGVQTLQKDLKGLARQREALYLATTALVSATRKATTAAAAQAQTPTTDKASFEAEEEEKSELLRCSTALLRCSADCVTAARPLLLRKGQDRLSFTLDLRNDAAVGPVSYERRDSTTSSTAVDGGAMTSSAPLSDTIVDSESHNNRSGNKGRHTVSMLARKATSLTCLKDQCEQSSTNRTQLSPILGEDESDDRVSAWQRTQSEVDGQEDLVTTPLAGQSHLSRQSRPTSLSDRRGVPGPANLQLSTPSMQPRSVFSTTSGTGHAVLESQSGVTSDSSRPPAALAPLRTHGLAFAPVNGIQSAPVQASNAGGEAMSRDESSRGSAASTATSSMRSNLSEVHTAETSPRSSVMFPSPIDEKQEWTVAELQPRRSSLFGRARSGSTPDRIATLRLAEGSTAQYQLSSRLPQPHSAPAEQAIPPRIWLLDRDYKHKECAFNADGNVTGATFQCLVERLTLHDQTIDPIFLNTFFLTFRLFTTPQDLAEALYARFAIHPPAGASLSEADSKTWHEQERVPIRLRVYNTFKTWLETYWRQECDNGVIESLSTFTHEVMSPAMPSAAQRLLELVQRRTMLTSSGGPLRARGLTRMASSEKLTGGHPSPDLSLGSATFPTQQSSLPPPPITSKSLMAGLRSPACTVNSIQDFDPLELARQLTIMENRIFCSIDPQELLTRDFGQRGTSRTSRTKMMSSLSTRITGWIADIILSERDAKKRTAIVKYFIKLNERLLSLQNYNTLMAVVAALGSSTISRLKKTWDGLSSKYNALWQAQQKVVEHSRNYALYRATIKTAVAPCLPFLGLYLTDITFCREGNAQYRTSPLDTSLRLINFDRYQKLAKIIGDLQRFQQPYNLVEILEIQSYMHLALSNVANDGDHHDLYRRSLLIEPREGSSEPVLASATTFNWRL